MTEINYKSSIGDIIWLIENNSIIQCKVSQLNITTNRQNTKIEYILNKSGKSYTKLDSEIYTTIVDVLLELSERYEP